MTPVTRGGTADGQNAAAGTIPVFSPRPVRPETPVRTYLSGRRSGPARRAPQLYRGGGKAESRQGPSPAGAGGKPPRQELHPERGRGGPAPGVALTSGVAPGAFRV